MTHASAPPWQQLLDLAAAGRPRPAIDFALKLIAAGQPVDGLIAEVLAPTQQQVGVLWQQNQWSVAQEHAATAVIDGVLGAVGLQVTVPARPQGSVLVACVEEEHHTLPARMGTERLRAAGWDVAFLGGSLPAPDLQRYAALDRSEVIVLSCTVPLFLPGANRCITAIAELGLPVVAAGAGFGDSPARAIRLGASAWIGPEHDPNTVLQGELAPARTPHPPHADAIALEIQADELIHACLAEMAVSIPQMSAYSAIQLAHTRTDLGHILGYLAIAIDLDDTPLFDSFISWLSAILTSRAVPNSVLALSLEIMAGVLKEAGAQKAASMCGPVPSPTRFPSRSGLTLTEPRAGPQLRPQRGIT